MSSVQLIAGLFLGIAVSHVAWKKDALTRDGALAAAVMGTLIFGLGGLPWAALLLTFFITSSGLSRAFLQHKSSLNEKFSKGSRRDWAQVAANGGLGALLILFQIAFQGQVWPWWAYAGALAAVNADTWATELGTLSAMSPRLITTGKKVENGTSGGITLVGTFATLIGAALIGGVAEFFPAQAGITTALEGGILLGAIAVSGLLGSLFDSFLGATLQAIYHCPTCEKETERHPHHTCGTRTVRTRGLPWLNNEGVNFAASLVGALIAGIIAVTL